MYFNDLISNPIGCAKELYKKALLDPLGYEARRAMTQFIRENRHLRGLVVGENRNTNSTSLNDDIINQTFANYYNSVERDIRSSRLLMSMSPTNRGSTTTDGGGFEYAPSPSPKESRRRRLSLPFWKSNANI